MADIKVVRSIIANAIHAQDTTHIVATCDDLYDTEWDWTDDDSNEHLGQYQHIINKQLRSGNTITYATVQEVEDLLDTLR